MMNIKLTKYVLLITLGFIALPSHQIIAEETPGEMIVNGDISHGTENWRLENRGNSDAGLTVSSEGPDGAKSLVIEVKESAGKEVWKVQLSQSGLLFTAGKQYRLTFDAKSSANTQCFIAIAHSEAPWDAVKGIEGKAVPCSNGWKNVEFTFKAPSDVSDGRLLLTNLNQSNVTWYFANFSLKEVSP